MNRRDFIKTASAVAVAPTALAAVPTDIPIKNTAKDRYFVECYTHDRSSTNTPYKQHELTRQTMFETVEDAVQYLFEHAKEWDLTKKDVMYNIMWSSDKGRLIQAGHYQFRDKETSCMMYQQGRWWSAHGWHGSPPYTDYYAVEAG